RTPAPPEGNRRIRSGWAGSSSGCIMSTRGRTAMAWPAPVEALWNDMESVRAQLLKEAEGLSQAQSDWRPSLHEGSVGEILHHLTLGEGGTGKLPPKLLGDAQQPLPPFPSDLAAFAPVPPPPPGR